jgi:hypothetical protein
MGSCIICTPPLGGDLVLNIGEFVAQVIFNSLSLLIRRCCLHDLHDSGCNHGSTIVRIGNAVPGVPLVRGGKALHLGLLLFGDRAMKKPAHMAPASCFNLVGVIAIFRSDTHQHRDGDAQCVELSGTELVDKVDQLDHNLVAADRVVVSPAGGNQHAGELVQAGADLTNCGLGAANMRRARKAMDVGGRRSVVEGH